MFRRKATQKQIDANRANAQYSTGAKTEAGREASSRNSFRHGLTGNFFVMEGESQEKFDQLVDRLIGEEQPEGILELEVVKTMAEHLWLRERASRFQSACFIVVPRTPEQAANHQAEMAVRPELERYMRYEAHHERAFQRALNELLKLRSARLKTEIGFVSHKQREEVHQQRVERHKYFVANAEIKLERELIRAGARNATAGGPRTLSELPMKEQIAA